MAKSIVVYITSDEKRVLGGKPLALLVKNEEEQKQLLLDLGRALMADTVQLKNGDYILISEEGKRS
ncbi:capping complex subunit for YIEGIA [Oscillibacter sp.]|uniref:capping complex subunit for YIEGIA n=1 Tax=Oscillibacter sp. TaxID=1945593 RepID=UPI0028A60F4D|nr:hypothetical protein [Oscillibacter sp.]